MKCNAIVLCNINCEVQILSAFSMINVVDYQKFRNVEILRLETLNILDDKVQVELETM